MVGYDDNADALTLGDDDVLKVGDYEIAYDSGANEWQAEYTPSGDVASVPKNQSGSLFPDDFADALSGQALADDGNLYNSIQDAENAASDWVFVGPGTFNENVLVDTTGLLMWGCGYNTHIDGGSSGTALQLDAQYATVKNLSVETTGGGGSAISSLSLTAADTLAKNVVVRDSDSTGISISGKAKDCQVINCTIKAADSEGIRGYQCPRTVVSGIKTLGGVAGKAINFDDADDLVIANCIVSNPSSIGIYLNGTCDDCIIIGNRVQGADDDGIRVDGTDVIIANNRVADSLNRDINNTNTASALTDDNLTPPSN